MKSLLTLLALAISFSTLNAQALTLSVDKPLADYQTGETISFKVESDATGDLQYRILHSDKVPPLAQETINHDGETTITFSYDEPTFLIFEAVINNEFAKIGVSVSKEDIVPFNEEPADFDAFWQRQKDLLSAVPIDAEVDFLEDNEFSKTYRISLASIDNRRAYGYLVVPNGDGPFPATLRLPAFGSSANIANPDVAGAERGNCITISMSIHNTPPDEEDPNSYEPDDSRDPDLYYYRYAILGGIRAIDYIETRDDWNDEDICIYGNSQGGGLAILIAGIDQRPNLLIQSITALSQHGGRLVDRPSGFPYYLDKAEAVFSTQTEKNQVFEASKYYDAMFAARRYQGPSQHFISYLDDVCPPATGYVAHNEMPGPRVMLNTLNLGHSSPDEFINDRRQFLRQHFPDTREPLFIWEPETQSHFIAAGEDQTISINETLDLAASFGFDNGNDPTDDWTITWDQVDGPGSATFSSTDEASTQVSFSDTGTYKLRLRVVDPYPEESEKFWVMTDELFVQVIDTTSSTNVLNTFEPTIFELSPNPSSDYIRIHAKWQKTSEVSLSIFSMTGQAVYTKDLETLTNDIDQRIEVSAFAKGSYMVQIKTSSGVSQKTILVH